MFRAGRTCAADNIVAEMLFHLEDDLLCVLAEVFQCRLLNHGPEDPDAAWDHFFVRLLQKRVDAKTIKQLRPISIIPVLSKLYSRFLFMLAGACVNNLKSPQFAFRAGYQAHEVLFIMRSMIEKSLERNTPFFVLEGDILKAYDYVRHSSVITGLHRQGVPDVLSAAWLRELRRSRSVFQFGSDVKSKPVARTRSLLQGDPSAPTLFNSALDIPACEFEAWCLSNDFGIRLHTQCVLCILLFADIF